jgi:hypothetical protein
MDSQGFGRMSMAEYVALQDGRERGVPWYWEDDKEGYWRVFGGTELVYSNADLKAL